jgi:hypothetical protein
VVIPAIVSNKIKSKGKMPSNAEIIEDLYTTAFLNESQKHIR